MGNYCYLSEVMSFFAGSKLTVSSGWGFCDGWAVSAEDDGVLREMQEEFHAIWCAATGRNICLKSLAAAGLKRVLRRAGFWITFGILPSRI